MNSTYTISFIGGGNMAQSLINGLINSNYDTSKITVSTPHQEKVELLVNKYHINGTISNIESCKNADILVLAVKPQKMQEVLNELSSANIDFTPKVIISIMAGVTIDRIKQLLPSSSQIIRVMPNTPSLIGQGMSGIYLNSECNKEVSSFVLDLFNSCGKSVIVANEDDIDNITAISGSAPAYFFMFMECLINKAKEYGFSEEDSKKIIEQVALGSVQMVLNNPNKSIAELREAVTSKGGTTYEALQVFKNSNLNGIVAKALDACKNRAKEMAKLF